MDAPPSLSVGKNPSPFRRPSPFPACVLSSAVVFFWFLGVWLGSRWVLVFRRCYGRLRLWIWVFMAVFGPFRFRVSWVVGGGHDG
ncbi:hypothetical protein A2U01_0024646 [Trifolium medium]|uniref:Transmembrane protein n=1 Tax=Trifolium medium TaxID=97028 RepID=A0A392NWX7_9FABA|nr:hypothetical protein [Trifolium medium]